MKKIGIFAALAAAISCVSPISSAAYATDIVTPANNYGLPGGQTLLPGDSFVSADGRFRFTFQTDGNFVLRQGTAVLWASNTAIPPLIEVPTFFPPPLPATQWIANPQVAWHASFQTDGNLVVYHNNTPTSDHSKWASNTQGRPNARFIVQNDGNAVIYDNGKKVWSTNTCCR